VRPLRVSGLQGFQQSPRLPLGPQLDLGALVLCIKAVARVVACP
jgi:hypothetical protein